MQVETKKIIKYLEDYLKVKDFEDYCKNGLQVEGAPKINKIITGVSLSQKLIKEAIKKKAKMIIVHHGIFKDLVSSPPVIKGVFKDRLKLILENNINFVGFHLPLDAHSKIGNNASLCNILGVKNIKPFDVGFIGNLGKEIDFNDFVNIVDNKLRTKSYIISAGSKKVKRVGIISGASSPDFEQAKELGADTFISGDVRESVVRAVEEVGINFINAGHYNTEKMGIQNLGSLIAKKFDVKVEFVDIPNEI